ncbi:hypothetical protein MRX96_041558 [Rhipicephalus microplus]
MGPRARRAVVRVRKTTTRGNSGRHTGGRTCREAHLSLPGANHRCSTRSNRRRTDDSRLKGDTVEEATLSGQSVELPCWEKHFSGIASHPLELVALYVQYTLLANHRLV